MVLPSASRIVRLSQSAAVTNQSLPWQNLQPVTTKVSLKARPPLRPVLSATPSRLHATLLPITLPDRSDRV